jgi:hypothetical protein
MHLALRFAAPALLASTTHGFTSSPSSISSSTFTACTSFSPSKIPSKASLLKPTGLLSRHYQTLSMSSQESIPSWNDLKDSSAAQPIGAALNDEVEVRKSGKGSAHASNKLRLFDAKEQPKITLYRDSAGKENFITVAACTHIYTQFCTSYIAHRHAAFFYFIQISLVPILSVSRSPLSNILHFLEPYANISY